MADIKQPTGPQEHNYPPPPGPPPGQNGLDMNPTSPGQQQQQQQQRPVPDSHSELYDYSPPPNQPHPSAFAPTQPTPHQPPPPDIDGAPKKAGWGHRISMFGSRAAAPLNMLANKMGAETFLPSTMEKEVEKAARILMAFCSMCPPSTTPLTHSLTLLTPLRSPVADGIYTDVAAPATVEATTTNANGKPTTVAAKPRKNRTLLTIPSKVIDSAVGLAIFTTARAGFHLSGATGSGILVARLPDGSWSPPTGIQVHSVGAGFMFGIDIYDCVVVINTQDALAAFTKTRMSLGSDLAVVAGPWGAGGSVDFAAPRFKAKAKTTEAGDPLLQEAAKKTDAESKSSASPPATPPNETAPAEKASEPQPNTTTTAPGAAAAAAATPVKGQKPSAFMATIKGPTYSYVKSRGFYAGVQVDGTIVTERKEANADFYGESVAVQQIICGDVPLVPGRENWVNVVKPLWDVIRGAEGWHAQRAGWMSQMSPDSGYGGGADDNNNDDDDEHHRPSTTTTPPSPSGYPTGFDPVSASPAPPKPPRPASTEAAGAAAAGVAAMNLGGGGSSAAGAEDLARERKEAMARADGVPTRQDSVMTTAPPGYSVTLRPGEMSPSPTSVGFEREHASAASAAAATAGAAAGGEQAPPAYVDDGTAKPAGGDTKA